MAAAPKAAPASCPVTAPMVSVSPPRLTASITAASRLSARPRHQRAASSVSTARGAEETASRGWRRWFPAAMPGSAGAAARSATTMTAAGEQRLGKANRHGGVVGPLARGDAVGVAGREVGDARVGVAPPALGAGAERIADGEPEQRADRAIEGSGLRAHEARPPARCRAIRRPWAAPPRPAVGRSAGRLAQAAGLGTVIACQYACGEVKKLTISPRGYAYVLFGLE